MPCTPTDGLVVKQPEARRSDVDVLWEGVLVRATYHRSGDCRAS